MKVQDIRIDPVTLELIRMPGTWLVSFVKSLHIVRLRVSTGAWWGHSFPDNLSFVAALGGCFGKTVTLR